MTLLVEVLGVLAVAAALRAMAGSVTWTTAIAAVAVVLGGIAMANQALSTARTFETQRTVNRALPRTQLDATGGASMGAREDFLAWADSRIPGQAPVWLVCSKGCGGIEQWITWRLLPRPFVDRREDARWILLYHAGPRDAGLRGRDAQRVEPFDRQFAIAPVPR